MGNKIARTTQISASEYYLPDLPSSYNLVYKETLGKGRFFKTIQCKHDEGLVLVKVYFKRGDFLDLKEYARRLAEIKEALSKIEHPHVWPFQIWFETDKAAYLLRQYFFSNLHDRISTRPFLSAIEKKWIAFQLLFAVKQCHEKDVCHGDIKCENVLVTSWNWVYLTDFASFKPTYLPDDDPSDFSFFFDTGGRRRCYIAPERFYDHGSEAQVSPDASLKPSMDVFSLGCVLAELFLEGQPLFELSQLLAYRRGQYDPGAYLEKVTDLEIRKMILHMIQLDPALRLTASSYLSDFASSVFPSYFSPVLHNFFSCLVPLDSDARVAMTQSAFYELHKKMMGDVVDNTSEPSVNLSSHSSQKVSAANNGDKKHEQSNSSAVKDGRSGKRGYTPSRLVNNVSRLLKDTEKPFQNPDGRKARDMVHVSGTDGLNVKDGVSVAQDASKDEKRFLNALFKTIDQELQGSAPLNLRKIEKTDVLKVVSVQESNPDFQANTHRRPGSEGMVLIASLLCSCIRSVRIPQLRRGAILLLKYSSFYIDDEVRLQHVLPYIIMMVADPSTIVKCAALQTLCDILPSIHEFPPSDAKIFPEYILSMLSSLPDESEESVRIVYAGGISKIALTAYSFLLRSGSMNAAGVLGTPSSSPKLLSSSHANDAFQVLQNQSVESQLIELRNAIGEVIQKLVMGTKPTPVIRRALLGDIGNLCRFFGQRQSNDVLLPILPAFLNDRDDQLRAVFYKQIVYVCFFIGQRSVEYYLIPYIEQALSDTYEAVIVYSLECLTLLCQEKLLRKRVLLGLIERAAPLLCYPSDWVRRSAVAFITASSLYMGEVDSHVYLSPVLRPFLRRQPASLASNTSLLACLKPPVTRELFYQALENTQSSDMIDRQRKIWYNLTSSPVKNDAEVSAKRSNGLSDIKGAARNWASKSEFHSNIPGQNAMKLAFPEDGSVSRSRVIETHIGNGLIAGDTRDPSSMDKLHFSGFSHPHVSAGNSFVYDSRSEGIPLYAFSAGKSSSDGPAGSSEAVGRWGSLGTGSLSIVPTSNPLTRSLNVNTSLSTKVVSGSVSLYNPMVQTNNILRDTSSPEIDEMELTTCKFKDVTLSGTLKDGSIILATDVESESDITGLPYFSRPSTMVDTGWRPRGVLVAHLQEHRSSVNDIAVSSDHSFFVSASDDFTVKVWDTRKLEKDISFKSRLTYSLDRSRALCATMLRYGPQVAVGDSDGTIHVFSVDHVSKNSGTTEKYLGFTGMCRKVVNEGAILSVLNYCLDAGPSPLIMYSNRGCGIHLWDMRTDAIAWTLKASPEHGYVSSLVTDTCGHWFVSGSSRGVLTLWDLRFRVPVNSWKYPVVCPVEKMCLLIPPPTVSLSSMSRPLVYVAAGSNEVSLWNAENGSCHQVFKLANGVDGETASTPGALAKPSNKSNLNSESVKFNYRLEELNEPPQRFPGIRSLLPLVGGDLLTGGTDFRIRLLDHNSPDRSYCVCGPTMSSTTKDEYSDTRSNFNGQVVQVVQETNKQTMAPKQMTKALLAAAAVDSAGCHRDSILSLNSVKLSQRLLISSSREGAIKVWK